MRSAKNILVLGVVLWMGLIFWFSAQPADDSARMSLSVGHVAGLIFIPDYESWPSWRQDAFEEGIDYKVRKTAHFTEYAVLGALLAAMFRSRTGERREDPGPDGGRQGPGGRAFFMALGTGAFYAATDEIHQLFVPGRSCQVTDVLLDSCGVAAGAAVLYLVVRIAGRKADEVL